MDASPLELVVTADDDSKAVAPLDGALKFTVSPCSVVPDTNSFRFTTSGNAKAVLGLVDCDPPLTALSPTPWNSTAPMSTLLLSVRAKSR